MVNIIPSMKNNKSVLIASDIFGLSIALSSLVEELNITKQTVITTPYQQPQIQFETEQQAYQCFQDHGGIDAYILSLADVLKSYDNIKHVIGFSAGAAAIYTIMSNLSDKNIQLTLFYPGQIRYFLDKHPSCPCHIIFSESESHFSLPDVINVLKKQTNLKVEQTTFGHGFMNKDSKAFNQKACNHYCQMLNVLVAKK